MTNLVRVHARWRRAVAAVTLVMMASVGVTASRPKQSESDRNQHRNEIAAGVLGSAGFQRDQYRLKDTNEQVRSDRNETLRVESRFVGIKRMGEWNKKSPRRMPRAFLELIPAASYSPTQLPVQYHRLRRA